MEQMCTGIYYFLDPVFVIAEWDLFPAFLSQIRSPLSSRC